MELLEMVGTALTGALASGGAVAAFFRTREREAEAQQAESQADPKRTAEFNQRLLLLFTRVASLESKLEQRDATIARLQEQVLQLQVERNQLRYDLSEAQREALGLKAEVAQLRAQVEGVS